MGSSHSGASAATNTAAPPPAPRYPSRVLPAPRVAGRPELSRTGVIKNSVNVKRSSVKRVGSKILFKFDSSLPAKFKVWFDVTEFLDDKKMPIFSSTYEPATSPDFQPGLDQNWEFTLPAIPIPQDVSPTSVIGAGKTFPIIIETVPLDEPNNVSPKQLTYLNVPSDKTVTVIKQKLRFGERGYELHEIFGMEKGDMSPGSVRSKRDGSVSSLVEEDQYGGTDCVICLTEPRDTTVLPCRHLCLCARCAEVLRINSRKCPICRQPVSSMLQIDRDIPPSILPPNPKEAT